MIGILILIFVITVLLFKIIKIYKIKQVIIYEIESCGLGNRLFGLSGSLVLSLLTERKLFVYHFEYIKAYIENSVYFSPINYINKNYTNFKTKSDGYCGSFCKFYNNILISKKEVFIIRNIYDLVPTMIKCRNIKEWFENKKFINNNVHDEKLIVLEINHILFTRLIILKKNVEYDVKKYIQPYNNECKIGLQLRDDDGCVINNNCKVNRHTLNQILIRVSQFNTNRSCWLFISSANKLLSKEISLNYKKSISFLPNQSPTHSSVVYNNNTYKKTIGDIIFPSLTDYLIVSDHSTYAKIILYKFYKHNILNNFIFIRRNGEINQNEKYTELIDNYDEKKCITFPEL